MMARLTQLIFLLCIFCAFTDSSDVFGEVGSSVHLDIQNKTQTFNVLIWKQNENNIIKYYFRTKKCTQNDPYNGRLEFNTETYSLILRNLQKNDSGLYKATASSQKNTIIAQYNLTVIDPVEVPVLTFQNSSDPCNFTLTCKGHDLSINSTCHNQTCEEKEGESEGVFLSLTIKGSLIICNQSNPVSWKHAQIDMKLFKSCDNGENTSEQPNLIWWLLGGALALLLILVVLGILVSKMKRKENATMECENTVYHEVGNTAATSPSTTLETASPLTVYSTVQPQHSHATEHHQQNLPVGHKPSNTYESVPEAMLSQPETIYATVQKPPKP